MKLVAKTSGNRASKKGIRMAFPAPDKYRGDVSSTGGEQLNCARAQSSFRNCNGKHGEIVDTSLFAVMYVCVAIMCTYNYRSI